MKKTKTSKVVAKAALFMAKAQANSTCSFVVHQPKLPKAVKKLRKF
jgi:cyclic lactone autoinducer peptide